MFVLAVGWNRLTMYFYHKVEDSVLLDLLTIHTNRLTQILIYGESYSGEYRTCKKVLELLQEEFMSRNKTDAVLKNRSVPAYMRSAS